MYVVYVLLSTRNGKRYVGCTSKLAAERLKEHNDGTNKFTRHNRPFRLLYQEWYRDKKVAFKRERFLKSGQGRRFLDSIDILQ